MGNLHAWGKGKSVVDFCIGNEGLVQGMNELVMGELGGSDHRPMLMSLWGRNETLRMGVRQKMRMSWRKEDIKRYSENMQGVMLGRR